MPTSVHSVPAASLAGADTAEPRRRLQVAAIAARFPQRDVHFFPESDSGSGDEGA